MQAEQEFGAGGDAAKKEEDHGVEEQAEKEMATKGDAVPMKDFENVLEMVGGLGLYFVYDSTIARCGSRLLVS